MQVYKHQVRFHEVDAQGFVFNARYLEFADVAMAEFLRALGWSYPDLVAAGADPSVVSATLTFKRPARLDNVLDVDVRCTRVGNSSFNLRFTLICGEHEIAVIEIVYVNVDASTAAARPLPPIVAAALAAAGS